MMITKLLKFKGWLAVSLVVILTLLTGCASAAPVAENNASAAEAESLKIGFVVHVKGNPFIQQIIQGAEAAGEDLGVEIVSAGPEGFDPEAQLKIVQDLFAAGADGVATSVPGESMAKGLNEFIENSKPIVQFNLLSMGVNAPYVGERSTESGRILGQEIVEELGGSSATGKAIIGICAPGFPSLENRAKGVMEGLAAAPGLEVLGPFDVKVDATENYSHWEQLLAANPDAKAMIGLCAPDVASLGQLNAKNGNTFVAGGYDLTEENLKEIEDGNAYVTLGQTAFLQGYMPVKMLVDHLRNGTELKPGFIESGTEIVKKDSVIMPYGLPELTFNAVVDLGSDTNKTEKFYAGLVQNELSDWAKIMEPIENEGK